MTSGTSACTNPSDMYYNLLADRVRFFKESKEGVAIMCRAIEDMWNRAVKEGILESNRETARRMLAAGKYTLSEIADITGLTLDEFKEIKAGESA